MNAVSALSKLLPSPKSLARVVASAALLAPIARADAPWNPLTEQAVNEKGICAALAESSPVREYYDLTCQKGRGEYLGRNDYRCTPKGELVDFEKQCNDQPVLACGFVAAAAKGAAPAGLSRMFEGLLLSHDRALTAKVIHLPKANQYIAGSCLEEENYRYTKALDGLGVVGTPEQGKVVMALIDSPEKLADIGAEERLQIVRALWGMGAKEQTAAAMSLLDMAHIQRYPGREFREMLLMAMAEWGAADAEALCEQNLRDIKDEADLGACMLYLARRGKQDAVKSMIRQVERARDPGLQAIGILGGKDALAFLTGLRDQEGEGPAYMARDVALVNAGDKKAWKDVEATLNRNARPDRQVLAQLGYLSTNPAAAKQAVKFLQGKAKAWQKENLEMYGLSVAIRTQLGDASAIPDVIRLLEGPDESTRVAVGKAIGGDFGNVWSSMPGFGLVAEKALIPALAEAHSNEANKGHREMFGRALVNVRAAVALRGK